MMAMQRLTVALFLALCWMSPTMANEPTKLRVNVFPGVQNLPIFVGQAKGIFARNGFDIELQFTPNSPQQREGLAKGAFEIAHAGVDNSVALADTGAGSIIVMGGDSSLQELFAQPGHQVNRRPQGPHRDRRRAPTPPMRWSSRRRSTTKA